jgi:CubicO group peptidase (beta-lactamase class C family)
MKKVPRITLMRMRSVARVLLLVAVATMTSDVISGQDDREVRFARALEAIDKAIAAAPVPGIAVGVTDRARTVKILTHGSADTRTNTPIKADSLFPIGSVSKSFTAVALMQLFDEGTFDPDAPIVTYLPWFSIRSTFAPITGRHLLTHTAGLPNYRADLASMRFATYALRDFDLAYAPGAHFWYSNLGFQTLGYALERIDGASYGSIIERRVLRRVGMPSTRTSIDNSLRTLLPTSYTQWPYTNEYLEEPWFEYRAADGSVVSTVEDMLAYVRMILNRGAVPGGRVLSERAFSMLTTPALNNYAFGLRVETADGNTTIGHGGQIAGFSSVMTAQMDDGTGIVMLGNAPMSGGLPLWVANTVRAAVRGTPLPALPEKQTAAQMLATSAEWAGTFRGKSGATLRFSATERGLVLTRGIELVPLTRIGRDSFRAAVADLIEFPFTFERADGKVAAVSHGADWYAGANYKGPQEFTTPTEYLPFVGRYENHNPEGQAVRVFIRNGQLMFANGISDAAALVPTDGGQFRPAQPDYNPERYRFDSIVDGHALRLLASGMPMYRVEDR